MEKKTIKTNYYTYVYGWVYNKLFLDFKNKFTVEHVWNLKILSQIVLM